MKTVIVSVLLFVSCAPSYSAEESEQESDEEECIYDQDEQEKAYLELEKKYPGSRYVEDQHKLLISDHGDEVTLRRGGCVHFGISVELRIIRTQKYESETVFLSKVTDLVTEYGWELIDLETLHHSISSKKWYFTKDETGAYYFLSYPDATFEMFRRHDDEYTVIGVSFYY